MALASVTSLLLAYKYLILFPAAVIEGPIITIIAGALIQLGILGWIPAYIIIVVGDTVGDVLHYAIGRWGGKKFLTKWGKYLGLSERHVEAMEKVFNGHVGKTFMFGKLAHGFGGALLVAAGLIEMSLSKFLFWNVITTMPKSLGLLLIGYYFAHGVMRINSALDVIASVTIVLGFGSFFVWAYWYGGKQKK